eukprot:1365808-Pleurochrysis_carterae.AAC.1
MLDIDHRPSQGTVIKGSIYAQKVLLVAASQSNRSSAIVHRQRDPVIQFHTSQQSPHCDTVHTGHCCVAVLITRDHTSQRLPRIHRPQCSCSIRGSMREPRCAAGVAVDHSFIDVRNKHEDQSLKYALHQRHNYSLDFTKCGYRALRWSA